MSVIPFTFRPIDPLYFGPPVGMPAGEVHGGRSLFPPPPMAFQGIVRTRLLMTAEPALDLDDWSRKGVDEREALIGPPDALPEGWQLQGPFPVRQLESNLEPWLPTPCFALRTKHGHSEKPAVARLLACCHPVWRGDSGPPKTDASLPGDALAELGAPESNAQGPWGGWVSPKNMRWLMTGQGIWDAGEFGSGLPPFVQRERRTGLAIDHGRGAAKDALLYTLDTLRLAPGTGFLGRLDASLSPRLRAASLTKGLGLAGRGARPVEFGAVGEYDPDWTYLQAGKHLPGAFDDGSRFWVVALTPARVARIEEPFLDSPPPGVTREVLGVLTGKSIVLGGFALARRGGAESRPNRRYLPAGTAWLVSLRGGDASARRRALLDIHDKSSVGHADERRFGFGHTWVGLYRE